MFSLLAGIWRYLTSRTEANILILGLDDAGKTTLLEKLKSIYNKIQGIPPSKIPPTIGLNVAKMNIDGINVTFWDVGGQVRLRSLWDRYYDDAHALIYVMDSADIGRFEESQLAYEATREKGNLHGLPFLLFANKQDLPGSYSALDISTQFGGIDSASLPFRVFPICALSGEGITEGMTWLIHKLKERPRRLE